MLDPKEKNLLLRIETRLAMPRWKFILIYGLSFGFALVLITSGIDLATKRKTVDEVTGKALWFNLLLIPVSGFIFAKLMHWLTVKKYLELKQKEKSGI